MVHLETAKIKYKQQEDGLLIIHLIGSWILQKKLPQFLSEEVSESSFSVKRIGFDCSELKAWDTSLIYFLSNLFYSCKHEQLTFDCEGLPKNIVDLLKLSQTEPIARQEATPRKNRSLLYWLGSLILRFFNDAITILGFAGEIVLSLSRILRGETRFRWKDCLVHMQQASADALPIVSLISFLVGIIMAFVGSVQLEPFGATIYIANLVGLAMVREMGAMMTGIIMAGRTGAAYAASLGNMKVNEEIDAFQTFAISPIDFLVMPRMVALSVMMPLLCIFADFVGILGGVVIGCGLMNMTLSTYIHQTQSAIAASDFLTGIIKSAVFGILVSAMGCLRGMQCNESSSGVGLATTSAVVSAITSLIIADAIFAFVLNAIGL